MGFADVTIAELAEDYGLSQDQIFALCRQFGIPFRDAQSFLALEDAKQIILEVRNHPVAFPVEPPRS
ncbi:hypothetical protein [Gloeobacter kilaueensis]|uniref:Translation initiation factor IF-2 n=1 Tax=Gloeobacter kilaueensis (strain ATCC BAA-2537 / CCAP 1431/1 / ULC 316 / JS1) TaxID=1183438 RepID=U5QIG1_GLOK1|nr:hypothetical protein [Gloeobacter kilaueensis]AGY58721.1 hypothetical protein GKIL_2475 [Gloeobacter kilaueensis JS1]